MAEIATIARPYAEALFESAGAQAATLAGELQALGALAAEPQLRQFADNPKVSASTVFNVISDVLGRKGIVLSVPAQNFLRTVLDNGRLVALPEIAQQFHTLVNSQAGVSDALIESAFEIGLAQLSETVEALERRFGRKLNPTVVVRPELIGGIRVTVGDEVLDTSVVAGVLQMRIGLTA